MDLCGPLQKPSSGGALYIATFLDDYSKLSVVQPIKTKSGAAAVVQSTLRRLETWIGEQVKTIRTDRGREYLNTTLNGFLTSKGITHQTTAPYTPEQNGAAERLNRTLLERARAMLEDADLPNELWAEAVVTANYIRNRSATFASPTSTPWELFFLSKPDVSHMRIFGVTAYVHIPDKLRKKLDPKSERGIFVGYEVNSKAYRVLTDDKDIRISRNVIFDEGAPLHVRSPLRAVPLAPGAGGALWTLQGTEDTPNSEDGNDTASAAETDNEPDHPGQAGAPADDLELLDDEDTDATDNSDANEMAVLEGEDPEVPAADLGDADVENGTLQDKVTTARHSSLDCTSDTNAVQTL